MLILRATIYRERVSISHIQIGNKFFMLFGDDAMFWLLGICCHANTINQGQIESATSAVNIWIYKIYDSDDSHWTFR
jgi:hypothetical protein